MKKNKQKGASLLLTLLVMAVLLSISFGVSRLALGEIKLIRDIPKALIAYYAAEAGMEWALYQYYQTGSISDVVDCSVNLDNGSSYGIEVIMSGEYVTAIKSNGCYQDLRRAVEVSF